VVVEHPTPPLVRVEWEDGTLLQWVDDLSFLGPNA